MSYLYLYDTCIILIRSEADKIVLALTPAAAAINWSIETFVRQDVG